MTTNPNDFAFPVIIPDENYIVHNGLTKREYFAAIAMQGIWFNQKSGYGSFITAESMARNAVQQADILIEELNKIK